MQASTFLNSQTLTLSFSLHHHSSSCLTFHPFLVPPLSLSPPSGSTLFLPSVYWPHQTPDGGNVREKEARGRETLTLFLSIVWITGFPQSCPAPPSLASITRPSNSVSFTPHLPSSASSFSPSGTSSVLHASPLSLPNHLPVFVCLTYILCLLMAPPA